MIARSLRTLAAVVVFSGIALRAESALADTPCPTTQTWSDAILKIYGFTPLPNHSYDYYIGMVDFYGTKIVAACVRDNTTVTPTLYAVTDVYDNLIPYLPLYVNHLCYSDDPSVREASYVLEGNAGMCGVTMYPLDYHGNDLVQYGRAGSDHLHGGYGDDRLYGGPGNDIIADYTSDSTAFSFGQVFGESNDDRLYTSKGFVSGWGGPGVDSLINYGGRFGLFGEDGDDCCIHATFINPLSPPIDCGGGSQDVVRTLAGTKNCEVASNLCGALPYSCPWF